MEQLADIFNDAKLDDPAPGQPAPAEPAPGQPAPVPAPDDQPRWIGDVKLVRLNKEDQDYVVKIKESFLLSDKEVVMSKEGREFKNEAGSMFRSVKIDGGIKKPSHQKYFLVGETGGEATVFPSLTSINKKYKNNMDDIQFILPICGNWRRVIRRV
eukprot:g38603.t1